jgi:hypothetical protein
MLDRMVRARRHCLPLLLSLLSALALPAAAQAAGTIHVNASSTADPASCGSAAAPCTTLQDAMLHATGGELVLVAHGNYPGATITVPLHLRGANGSVIRSTLEVSAAIHVDGLDFDPGAGGPAIRFVAASGGGAVGASVVTNATFIDAGGHAAIQAAVALAGLVVSDSRFVAGSGSAPAALHLDGTSGGAIAGVRVERNEFRGFSGAVVNAAATSGLRITGNRSYGVGSLLALSDADGSTQRIQVHDNVGEDFSAHAIHLGRGVRAVTVERNRLAGGTRAALRIDAWRGSGSTADVVLRANDLSGFGAGISVDASLDGLLQARGNRIVDVQRAGPAVSSSSPGTVDVRRNWWGTSAGPAAGAVVGADASEPLRLVGVEAPSQLFAGGTGVIAVQLVGPFGGASEPDASGFTIQFSTTAAGVAQQAVTFAQGRASTLLHASSVGTTTTTATLDGETVTATTRIVPPGNTGDDSLAEPSAGQARPRPAALAFVASRQFITSALRDAPTVGFKQRVTTNQHASVRATYMISHYDARRLGLRPRTNHTRNPFVIARVHTRPIRGTRIVTAPIGPRPAFALRQADFRVAVHVVTVVRTRDGQQRAGQRRIVIPVNAR